MLTVYELELEVRRRAADVGKGSFDDRGSRDRSQSARGRASSVWLAGTLRAMADRLEARAFRTA